MLLQYHLREGAQLHCSEREEVDTHAIVTINVLDTFMTYCERKHIEFDRNWLLTESYGQLVLLSFVITDFTLATYQRRSLQRPLKEISS